MNRRFGWRFFTDDMMLTENPFRVSLAIVILLTMAITAYHRIQAASSRERISRKEEGYLFAVLLRLSGLALFVVTFAYLVAPQSVQWAMLAIRTPKEEQMLIERFGQQYRDYMARTGRFLPRMPTK